MIYKIAITVVYGIVLGLITIPLSKKLTLSRTEDPGKAAPLNKAPFRVLAVVLGIAAAAGIVFTTSDIALAVRNLLLLIPIFSISFVDALVRKIPNPLLLTMLVIDAGYIIYVCVTEKSTAILPKVFVGFFIGMLVCYIPSVLKIPMGAGDIKYSGVIGLTIYAMGYFQSMILMSVFVGLFYLYLKLTKKGGMKTQIPMGPFLSLGTVISMCVSLLDFIGTDLNSLL